MLLFFQYTVGKEITVPDEAGMYACKVLNAVLVFSL